MTLMLICDCPGRYIRHEKGTATCSKCGTKAISAPPSATMYRQLEYNYECPITGIPITTKHAHEENLARHGKHVLEKGEFADAERTRAALNEEFENKVCETAAQLVHDLPAPIQAALEQELLSTDLKISRG